MLSQADLVLPVPGCEGNAAFVSIDVWHGCHSFGLDAPVMTPEVSLIVD